MNANFNLHGVFINIFGLGTLITGHSGSGKSELALQLISNGHQLIADDVPLFYKTATHTLMGESSEILQDFLEVRGLGILNIRVMFGEQAIAKKSELKFIIHLKKFSSPLREHTRLKGCYKNTSILDVDIPEIELSAESNRDLLILSEAAVRQQLLKFQGYDSYKDFENRQRKVTS